MPQKLLQAFFHHFESYDVQLHASVIQKSMPPETVAIFYFIQVDRGYITFIAPNV